MIDLVEFPYGLMQDDDLITNFIVPRLRPLYDAEGIGRLDAIELEVRAPDQTYTVCVNVKKSIVDQILDAVPSCRLLMSRSAGAVDAYIIDRALSGYTKGLFFQSSGLHRLLNKSWVFVAGDEILGNCEEDAVVDPSVASIRLACDRSCDSHQALVRVVGQIEKNPSTVWPTFTYTLLASLRSEITKLGSSAFPVLYLVGRQGVGKTVLASRYSLLYDQRASSGKAGMLESNSTPKGIVNAISSYRDQVVLVDDLALGSDPSIRRERQKVIAEVLRFAANGNMRQTAAPSGMDASRTCHAGVVFTGEIPLTAASDITRMIKVPLKNNMTGGCESDRADAATAFRTWMLWLLPHLDDELNSLKLILSKINGGEEARLETSTALLLWTVELFYRFLLEEDVVDKGYYDSILRAAKSIFGQLMEDQVYEAQQVQDTPPKGNLCWYILDGYRNNAFHVVPTRKAIRFDKDCVVENDALCIKSSVLLLFLQRQPGYQGLTKKMMTKQLKNEGVLSCRAESRNATKRIKGKRYLELGFELLKVSSRQY